MKKPYVPYGDEWAKLLLKWSYKKLAELGGIKHRAGTSKEDFIQEVRKALMLKKQQNEQKNNHNF